MATRKAGYNPTGMASALLEVVVPDKEYSGGMNEKAVGVTKKVGDAIKKASMNLAWPDNYHIIDNEQMLIDIAAGIRREGRFVFDTETSGLNEYRDKVYCVSMYVEGHSYLYVLEHRFMDPKYIMPAALFTKHLGPLFSEPGIKLIGHNLKFDAHFIQNNLAEVATSNLYFDTYFAAWMLEADKTATHGLKGLSQRYGFASHSEGDYGEQFGLTAWSVIEPTLAAKYACRDPELTALVYEKQCSALPLRPRLSALFWEYELPILRIAYNAEKVGLQVDEEYFYKELKPWVYTEYATATNALAPFVEPHLAYVKANTVDEVLSSPKKLGQVFFEKIGIPEIENVTLQKKKNKKGEEFWGRALDKNAIAELKDEWECMALLGDWRKIHTVKVLFIDQITNFIIDGVLHMSINTIGTETGRMSMKRPNLQQVPSRMGARVRNTYVSRPGNVLVSMDFSQQELRVLAHYSQDPTLLQIFRDDKDLYSETAYALWGRDVVGSLDNDEDKKKSTHRAIAKILILGLVYGMGFKEFARTARIPESEAKKLYNLFHATYPGVKQYTARTTKFVKANGFIVTMMGRERPLPLIYAEDKKFSSYAERAAGNTPIQGSSADMTKKAAVLAQKLIDQEGWPVRIALFVHDEIIFEVEEKWIQTYPQGLEQIKHVLETAMPLSIPMKSSLMLEKRWGTEVRLDAVDYELLEDLEDT
jgi:DNA polymerase-1